jgi:hypothetical protein
MSDRPAPTPADYLVGLGGAAVLAAGLTASRGLLAGVLVGGVAAGGLLLRWASAPLLVLLVAAYLSLFPDGLPLTEPVGRGLAGPTLLDLLTVAAALAYSAGHYRALTRAADGGDEPTADDLAGLFGGVAAATVVGTLVVLFVTRFQPDYGRRPLWPVPVDVDDESVSLLELVFSRFVLLAGLLGGGALLAGLVLWLTRLNRLTADEARLLLLDTGWQENRRELARLETWRAAATCPRPARPRRRVWRSLGIGLLAFAATFVLFLCVLSRLR